MLVKFLGPGLSDLALVTSSFFSNYNISTLSYFAPSFALDEAKLGTFARLTPNNEQIANALRALLMNFNWSLGNLIN